MGIQDVSITSKVATSGEGADHACSCGEAPSSAIELDARGIPHAIRHAAIFGSLEAIQVGFALDLIAPHDPRPLIVQVGERFNGAFAVSYVEQGPEKWVVRFTRS